MLSTLSLLERLDVSGNRIELITSGDFVAQSNLTFLDISKNAISRVEARHLQISGDFDTLLVKKQGRINLMNVFANCSELMELDLSHNRLVSIEPNTYDLKRLRFLRLANNRIRRVHFLSFRRAAAVREVNLSSNAISEIESGTFSHLPQLETVTLAGNGDIQVASDAFARGAQAACDICSSLCINNVHSDENLSPRHHLLCPYWRRLAPS